MEEELYKVYIKIDERNRIIGINSSAFLRDTEGWIEVDSGSGDKYHHAQNNYLPDPLVDENGLYNYRYIDGQAVRRSAEEKEPEIAHINALSEIAELKAKLAETDYIAAKIAEGAAAVEEYSEEISRRAEWRARINELEAII